MTLARRFIKLNQNISKKFDGLLAEKWRMDGLEDYRRNVLPAYITAGITVCDVGGGGKRPYISKARKNKDSIYTIGVDISKEELDLAEKGLYDETYVSDIAEFRAKHNTADLVICQAVLEHVSDTRSAITAIERVLKPEGRAVLFIPCKNAAFAKLNLLLPEKVKKKLLFSIFPNTQHAQGFPAYYDHCSPSEIARLAKDCGMRVDIIRPYFHSNYFTFLFPLHFLWRSYQRIARPMLRDEICESFSIVISK